MNRARLLPRAAYGVWERLDLRWDDADRYGHVNNAVHYRLMDSAVNRWLVANGMIELTGHGPIFLVAETGCRYVAPLDFPGSVDLGLAAENVGTSSVAWRIGLFGAEPAAAAEGRFVHVLVDAATRRPVPMPEAWRDRLQGVGFRP